MQLSELIEFVNKVDVDDVSVPTLVRKVINELEVDDAVGTEILVAAVNYKSAKDSFMEKLVKLDNI